MNYLIEAKLPEAVSEDSLAAFVQIVPFETLSFSSKRDKDAFSGDWQLIWVVEGSLEPEFVLASFNDALNVVKLPQIAEKDLKIELLADDINWLEQSYQGFEPFTAGQFFIHGAHYQGEMPDGAIPLCIDASIAFGSGEHGTTNGCLQLLSQLADQTNYAPKNILDMGCGSGILAVAAAKLWPNAPALGVDIEHDAEILTLQHAALNNVQSQITAATGDGYKTPIVKERALFDLIIANILPGPLKQMAPDMYPCLETGGYLMLSGILHEQAASVIDVHDGLGLKLVERLAVGDWTSLLYLK